MLDHSQTQLLVAILSSPFILIFAAWEVAWKSVARQMDEALPEIEKWVFQILVLRRNRDCPSAPHEGLIFFITFSSPWFFLK